MYYSFDNFKEFKRLVNHLLKCEKSKALSNEDLEKILKSLNIDRCSQIVICPCESEINPEKINYFILSFDHWFLTCKRGNQVYFYDSNGLPWTTWVERNPDSYFTKIINQLNVTENVEKTDENQQKLKTTCGYHCLYQALEI